MPRRVPAPRASAAPRFPPAVCARRSPRRVPAPGSHAAHRASARRARAGLRRGPPPQIPPTHFPEPPTLRRATQPLVHARVREPKIAKVVALPVSRPKAARQEPDPAALLVGVLDGDPAAQAAIWDAYSASLRAVLRRTLGPGADVEDALQEVFLRFFQSAANLREPSSLRSFLIGIAVRVASGELRRRRVRRWFFLTADGQIPEPESALDAAAEQAREAVRRLYAILDTLDDASRLAFVLRHVERLELTEVAAAMGVSLATVKRKLGRVVPVVVARSRADEVLSRWVTGESNEGDETVMISEEAAL
jgi:RNA polymerase sigma-70 factor, ECF subfamily